MLATGKRIAYATLADDSRTSTERLPRHCKGRLDERALWVGQQRKAGLTPRWNRDVYQVHIGWMAKRPRLLEVNVVALRPERWQWQVCEGDTVIFSGVETSRETAQMEADGALFFVLRFTRSDTSTCCPAWPRSPEGEVSKQRLLRPCEWWRKPPGHPS